MRLPKILVLWLGVTSSTRAFISSVSRSACSRAVRSALSATRSASNLGESELGASREPVNVSQEPKQIEPRRPMTEVESYLLWASHTETVTRPFPMRLIAILNFSESFRRTR